MAMCVFKIRPGYAKIILPVLFPAFVEKNTPFNIQYTVKNTGGADDLYGFLTSKGRELTGSRWSKRIGSNRTITMIYRHPGLSEIVTITLWVGYL